MRLVRRPRFVDDLSDAYAYLADRSPASARRLLDEVDLALRLIAAFPQAGRPRDELRPGIRSFRVRGFRHVVFYRLEMDAVVLMRILHGARDIHHEI